MWSFTAIAWQGEQILQNHFSSFSLNKRLLGCCSFLPKYQGIAWMNIEHFTGRDSGKFSYSCCGGNSSKFQWRLYCIKNKVKNLSSLYVKSYKWSAWFSWCSHKKVYKKHKKNGLHNFIWISMLHTNICKDWK